MSHLLLGDTTITAIEKIALVLENNETLSIVQLENCKGVGWQQPNIYTGKYVENFSTVELYNFPEGLKFEISFGYIMEAIICFNG